MTRTMAPSRWRSLVWRERGRMSLRVLGAAYLAGVWLDGTGTGIPAEVLPGVANYFVQVSALFPYAATASIDYRAEGYVCSEGTWQELDTRPYFPINREDKENRFNRAMHFLRTNRPTMTDLDSYLVEHHNAASADDGIPRDERIGGVRLSSLRIPIPEPGDRLERFTRRSLSSYGDAQRAVFYHTPRSRLAARCGRSVGGAD